MTLSKIQIRPIIFLLLALLCFLPAAAQDTKEYTPDDVVNPNIADRTDYIADPAGMLSPATKQSINRTLDDLRRTTTAEVGVAILPSIGDRTVDDFAPDLLKEWGLGKKDKDNGLLLLIVLDQKKARIETGYGMEGVVTDMTAATILRDRLFPAMREGDIDRGVSESVGELAKVITDPAYAEELRSDQGDTIQSSVSTEDIKTVLEWFCGIITLLTAFCYIADVVTFRKYDRYHRALHWRKRMKMYWLSVILSLGGSLIFALLALWQKQRSRNKPMRCANCHHKMKKLSESEDNKKLTPAQDLEERLKSVDYDVWVCPQCGSVDKYAYPAENTKFTKCPACHTVAMHTVADRTLVPPTTRSTGVGERVSVCEFCGHQKHDRYNIPKKEDAQAAAAALAAAALLSGGRGHGGGGGSFGGGFGGGMSGGGGASGGW